MPTIKPEDLAAGQNWEKAADAAADKVWICRETGRIYDRWSPIAEPHGSFNTIVWGDSQTPHPASVPTLVANGNDLVIEPAPAIAAKG